MEELTIFLKRYPIVFIVVPIGMNVDKLVSFIISESKLDINKSIGIPKENNKDTMLIICDNDDVFSEIHENKFLFNKFEKFPSQMIVILPIMKMMFMNDPLTELNRLKSYKIPILLCNIFDISIDINIKVLKNDINKTQNFTVVINDSHFDIDTFNILVEFLGSLEILTNTEIIIMYNVEYEDKINDLVLNIIKIKSYLQYLSSYNSKYLDYFDGKIVVR